MAIDQALKEALDTTLAEATDQSDDFKKRFRKLITLVLRGNYEDGDVRDVMECVRIRAQSED